MRLAGIEQAYFILRSGKWDIPTYFGDGTVLDMHLGYLLMQLPFGVPYTLDQAYPFVKDATIAFGFPDILFQPEDAFAKLLARQATGTADVVLGLFPTDQPHKVGVVEFDEAGQVSKILEKSGRTDLPYMWGIAVWGPTFTQFMHDYLAAREAQRSQDDPPPKELPIGDVIQAAIHQELRVEAEVFSAGQYLDIGTPQDLIEAVHQFASQAVANPASGG